MSNGLVVLETSNAILNRSLYDLVKPQSLLAWHRIRVANMVANNGKEWSDIIKRYNSGTYNNQYMVIDYNKFEVGKTLNPGTLWVSEQIPGLVVAADVTDQLIRGYWPSYNVPYFKEIYERSGYPEFVKKHGIDFSYQMCPRAKIFRRDQNKVVDFESFKDIMRYNNYKEDPYSNGNPGDSICARYDLSKVPGLAGCYDSKVTSYALSKKMSSYVINGPTTSHNLPPFDWTKYPNGTKHDGQPNIFNFNFVLMDPNW